MTKTLFFRSRRAYWFTFATFVPFAVAVYLLFETPWYQAFIMVPVMVLIFPIYFRTHYQIHPINGLTITCGLFYRKNFDIQQLKSIRPSNNSISSPALSLKRLELRFDNRKILLISPVDHTKFIEAIKSINPEVEVKK